MDEKALHLVKSYILEHIDKADKLPSSKTGVSPNKKSL